LSAVELQKWPVILNADSQNYKFKVNSFLKKQLGMAWKYSFTFLTMHLQQKYSSFDKILSMVKMWACLAVYIRVLFSNGLLICRFLIMKLQEE